MKGIALVLKRCRRYLRGLLIKGPAYSLLTFPKQEVLKDFSLVIIRKTSIFVRRKYRKEKKMRLGKVAV